MSLPKVTVCIITYNHVRFIRQCIESVVSQKYDGRIEVIIANNSSTDGTTEICEELAKAHSELIIHLITDRSSPVMINGQATGQANVKEAISIATGKYIALVEGDDYWLTDYKLKKQVEHLEANSNCTVACSDVLLVDDNGVNLGNAEKTNDEDLSIIDLAGANFIYTASVMYRADHIKQAILHPTFKVIPAGDYFLHFFSAASGMIHVFAERLAAYRIHSGGTWAGKSNSRQLLNLLLSLSYLIRLLDGNKEAEHRLVQTAVFHFENLFSQSNFKSELEQFAIHQPEFCSRISKLKKQFELDFNPANRRSMVSGLLLSVTQPKRKGFFGRFFSFR